MKNVRVLASAAFAATLLASACAPAPPRQTLRMVYPHELVTLDPHAHRDLVTRTVLSAVYEGLVRFDPGLPVRPWLADRWTNPDQRTWWIHIREGVLFHDGRPVTPADVVASIERIRSGALGGELEDVESVRELSEQPGTVEITTSAPSPLLLANLQMMAVVPRDFDPSVPVGTGPYRWQMGSARGPLLFERWDRYWGETPDFDQVSIQFVPVLEELASLLHQDRVDCVASVTVSYVAGHRPEAGWHIVSSPGGSTTYLALNVKDPPLDDPRVRSAVDRAIDRRAIVEQVFPKGTVKSARSLVPPEVFGYAGESDTVMPADTPQTLTPGAVQEENGSPLFLDYSNRYPPFVDFLVQALAESGLEVEPRPLPYEDLYHRIETGGSRMYIFSWHFLVADALPFLNALIHSRDPLTGTGRFNGTDFSDPKVDAEIRAAAHEPLSEPRLEHLRRALARTTQAHVYLPLINPQALALLRDRLTIEPVPGPLARPQDVYLVE